ncbi:penicillin-binding protein transpeptidase domain-containing protein [Candidatus Magnetomorum sp. HK-1]|nr:penicillin-binding protein transpeptidase domain-containing protein [Candidatus Magnetomorum sp. HK-1]
MDTQPNWRSYQKHLLKDKYHYPRKRSRAKFFLLTPFVFLIVYGLVGFGSVASNYPDFSFPFVEIPEPQPLEISEQNPQQSIANLEDENNQWTKEKVRKLLNSKSLINMKDNQLDIVSDNTNYVVKTSIDLALQEYLLKIMRKSYTRYLAIVVMEPKTGRIISMVGFDKTQLTDNPCIEKRFPAASIFKIVTAAAAIEICGLDPDTELSFNGRKYTLYRKQITEKTNRYTNKISFKNSFAQSVNPVFGKLGSLYLGKSAIEEYAEGFGFNKNFNFELAVNQSKLHVKDEQYHQAEIACGFNRETLITPLHGALLVSSILNDGKIPEPTIVDQITDPEGKVCYKSQKGDVAQAITSQTCKKLKKLMGATVKSGTARKSFRGFKRDRILSKLNIGGKTGSISNKKHDVRFDWFVGYAEQKNGSDQVVISAIVAHDKYIGTRACRYARSTIKEYFKLSHSDHIAKR